MDQPKSPYLQAGLEAVLQRVEPDMARILDKALAGGEVTVEDDR